ncbi:MAG: cation-translocating P-type ATPase [Anaerolineae bacterium]|nr:cation-translocating P-type ATPase [Anaerolineae bacterium]
METQTYTVRGMDCAHCAETIEKGVRKLTGVEEASVDFTTGKLRLKGDPTMQALQERIAALGYELEVPTETPKAAEPERRGVLGFLLYLASERETQLALAGSGLIVLTLIGSLVGLPTAIQNVLFTLALIVAGYPIARSGLQTLFINRDFNINLLMTIAGVGALLIGQPLEAATVLVLFAIGEALEGYTADRARDSLRGLMALAPTQAILLDGTTERVIPVASVRVGDRVLIKPGERIAVDGVIRSGSSEVNQAPITGESIPVGKFVGNDVFAGTINSSGTLTVETTRLAADNTLSRIIRMVEEAQSVRAPSQRLIDQFARWYTPAVVVVAAVVALIPPLLFNAPFYDTATEHGWLYRALSMLVIACPCALVISAPVTIISAITAAARRGVLIKGGLHLEALGMVRAVAFDKTGTLTRGEPVVKSVRSVDCETGEACERCDEVLALATAVERRSTHPLAKAVLSAAERRGVAEMYAPAEAVEAIAGRGVRGSVKGKLVTIGSHAMFDTDHPHQAEFCDLVNDAETHGQTTMLLSYGDRVRGYIGVADEVRADSRNVVRELGTLGLQTIMLTGDNAKVADAIGQEVGVSEIRANLLPEDKVDNIRTLMQAHHQVAMVGDGINDTPALATATVGIAMGGMGSAQAMETADVVLMADDLSQLPFAIRVARFARQLIRQNVILSFGLKFVFLVLALEGSTSLWAAIFADVGMSLIVTLNGMRPLRFKG